VTARSEYQQATAKLLDRDEVDGVLSARFFTPDEAAKAAPAPASTPAPSSKPTHYKVICISMYNEDLGRLDEMVATLKARGYTKANRSALIRHALTELDLDQVPRGM
jgi:hypothetical protein